MLRPGAIQLQLNRLHLSNKPSGIVAQGISCRQWFGVSQEPMWATYTWHCQDACFSKMWGYDFVIAPEQSILFAIGKIEVSTVPFE